MNYKQSCKRTAPSNPSAMWKKFRCVFCYVFDLPEKRRRAGDFVWSYDELADHIPE